MTETAHRGKPRRVTLFGAESTGKTTLAEQLGRHFDAVIVPEYGRNYTEQHGQNASTAEDMLTSRAAIWSYGAQPSVRMAAC